MRMTTKPKLRTYQQLKTNLVMEDYLICKDHKARAVITRLRGGTHELRIETGRYPITTRDRKLEVEERRCLLCISGAVEDEQHFMVECEMYCDLRIQVSADWEKRTGGKWNEVVKEKDGGKRILEGLIGQGGVSAAALLYSKCAMTRRNNFVRTHLDQKT